MAIKNALISLSRRYRVIMTTKDGEEISVKVTLPDNLTNNAATVELWYHAYVPKGHLIVDIEVEIDPVVRAATPEEDAAEAEYEGVGDSLDYIGQDEPTSTEDSEEDDDGRTFIDGSADNSPKDNL